MQKNNFKLRFHLESHKLQKIEFISLIRVSPSIENTSGAVIVSSVVCVI